MTDVTFAEEKKAPAAEGGAASLHRIMVYAGPTGGHLFPAMAFAERLRERHPACRLALVTSRRGAPVVGAFPDGLFDEVLWMPDFSFPSGGAMRRALFLLKLGLGFVLTGIQLLRFRPELCAGFGSFVSFPGLWMARRSGIRTLIHEQNRVPGKANQWLARDVDAVAESFAGTFSGGGRGGVRHTGFPLRRALTDAARGEGSSPQEALLTVLVLGGSQGSARLNETVFRCFEGLPDEEKQKFAVIHITGSQDYARLTEAYRRLRLNVETAPFAKAMQNLYQKTHLAITRAGAGTLFELSHFRIPAVVVPYPYAGDHQEANARFFESQGAVVLKREKDLTDSWLRERLTAWQRHPEERQSMAARFSGPEVPEPAGRLVAWTEELIGVKR